MKAGGQRRPAMKLGIFVWAALVLASCTTVEVVPIPGSIIYGDFTLKPHGRL
jgi:hypothetical protein